MVKTIIEILMLFWFVCGAEVERATPDEIFFEISFKSLRRA